ncbi:MAG TPA: hypothetical protein VGO62_13135, partial [Myxococcota bacterium]
NTRAAFHEAERRGLPLWGAAPDVVARVHDKAFAARVAREHRVDGTDDPLAPLVTVVDAPVDAPVDAAVIANVVAAWPAWARARFTVKPRFGTSGRGRVPGVNGHAPVKPTSFPDGAVIEPWLARLDDLSSLWFVDDDDVSLLGSTAQIVGGAGSYRGCTVVGGRSGLAVDDEAVARARVVVEAAQAAGYRGPCGVDAFTYAHDGRERLRSLVELNARFTAGHVALALAAARRAPRVRFSFAVGASMWTADPC